MAEAALTRRSSKQKRKRPEAGRGAAAPGGGPRRGLAGPGAGPLASPALLSGAALALVALFCVVYGYRQISSPDLGFYLATGRDIWAAGAIPRVDTLTWTRANAPYVDLWWGYALSCWLAWSAGGGLWLHIGHLSATLACLGIALQRARQLAGRLPISALPLLLLFALGNTWEPRPHVATWLYLSLTLWVLERDAAGAARRGVWLLPVVFWLWINTHSLFVLGFVVLGAHWADRLLDRERRREKTLVLVGLTALALCLVNPFGVEGLLLPLRQFEIAQGSAFVSPDVGVAEYRGLFDFSDFEQGERLVWFKPHLFVLLYGFAAVVGLIGAWPRRRWYQVLLSLAFGYLFVSAVRNFGFFFLVTFPTVATGLDSLLGRLAVGRRRLRAGLGVGLPAAVGTAALGLIALCVEGRLFAWEWLPHRLGSSFNADILPVRLGTFMVDHGIEGRMLNSWDDGGYLAFATGQKTFIDGRAEVMGEEHFRRYLELKDPRRIGAALERFDPDLVVVPHTRIPLWQFTFARKLHWKMIYADDRWALFLRPGLRPDLPASPLAHPEAGRDYPLLARSDVRRALERERDEPSPGLRECWRGRDERLLGAIRRSGFFFQSGHPEAAAAVSVAAMAELPYAVPDLYLNAGYALQGVGDRADAGRAFSLFVEHSRVRPDVERVQRLLARLPDG
jgi:hypothetical protein